MPGTQMAIAIVTLAVTAAYIGILGPWARANTASMLLAPLGYATATAERLAVCLRRLRAQVKRASRDPRARPLRRKNAATKLKEASRRAQQRLSECTQRDGTAGLLKLQEQHLRKQRQLEHEMRRAGLIAQLRCEDHTHYVDASQE